MKEREHTAGSATANMLSFDIERAGEREGVSPTVSVMPNMLSFDIEGQAEELHRQRSPSGRCPPAIDYAVEKNTLQILEWLDGLNQPATFFILGRIGRDLPRLVRAIADAGHEIACHSLYHRRLDDAPLAELRSSLGAAKRYLEDAGGRPVLGFRAPQFSITTRNLHVLDLLHELGFAYDSSIYPTGLREFYGIAGFPKQPVRQATGLISVPLPVVRILNRDLPFGGGGYLRLYPLAVTKHFFRRLNRQGLPVVVYCHPYEAGDTLVPMPGMPWHWKLRSLVGRQTVRTKLTHLIREFRFLPIKDYLDSHPVASWAGPFNTPRQAA